MTELDAVKSKVVVVDDDAAALGVTSDLMAAEGYEVLAAGSIDQGLQMTEDRRPDVVLFCILKPPAGVIDFARRLALNSSTKFIPVVMVTALNEYQVGSFLNGVPGIRRILPAPCSPEALRAEISHALRHVRR